MTEPLLTKDAVNIAGHKLPLPLVGAGVALLGVIVVLRARSRGASVAGAGTPAAPVESVGVLGQGQEAQLANIEQQLGTLNQQLFGGAPAPAPSTSGPDFTTLNGHIYQVFSGSKEEAAAAIAAQSGGRVSDILARLDFFDPNGAVGGKFYYPVNVPTYRAEDLPFWQSLIVR